MYPDTCSYPCPILFINHCATRSDQSSCLPLTVVEVNEIRPEWVPPVHLADIGDQMQRKAHGHLKLRRR